MDADFLFQLKMINVFYLDIASASLDTCFDSYGVGEKRPVKTEGCHNSQGNQYFRYDLENKHIYHGSLK